MGNQVLFKPGVGFVINFDAPEVEKEYVSDASKVSYKSFRPGADRSMTIEEIAKLEKGTKVGK